MKLNIVFITPQAVPFLKISGFIAVEKIEEHHYFICNKIEENSNYFVDLHINSKTSGSSFDYVLSIPYQYVQYVVCAEDINLNKILGFHTSQPISDNPQEKPRLE